MVKVQKEGKCLKSKDWLGVGFVCLAGMSAQRQKYVRSVGRWYVWGVLFLILGVVAFASMETRFCTIFTPLFENDLYTKIISSASPYSSEYNVLPPQRAGLTT